MSVTFPEVRIGEPIRHDSLAVFPLFAEPAHPVEYQLSDAAIAGGSVTVEETSEAGSVPELAVRNTGELAVLFLEGEQLIGAKQNRILNTSVLIAARTQAKIPVSCVEAGRWRYRSRQFNASSMHAPTMLRRVLKASVSRSVREKRGHRSDQHGVWDEVARQQEALGAASNTRAMADTFDAHRARLEEFQRRLDYVEGAVGVAVAVGGKVMAIDLFDKAATCGSVWKRLLSGAVLDALELEQQTAQQAEAADVERTLAELSSLPWEPAESVGEGQEYRAESAAGDHATALVVQGTLVHGSVMCHA